MNKQIQLFPQEPGSEEEEIRVLTEKLLKLQHEYYVLNAPSVSDREYDSLFDRLQYLEKKYPQLASENSPVKRVGSDLSSELPEVRHTVPVLSLDKVYTPSELIKWIEKTRKASGRDISFTVEEKIDGISIVLYYEKGVLKRAVTRGNGETGNDVTANVRTIGSVPLVLSEPANVAVRGEIYLPLESFNKINQSLEVRYANPRNLAAGTIRRIRSSETGKIPLNVFVYEGFFEGREKDAFKNHHEILEKLIELGFRVSRRLKIFTENTEIQEEKKSGFSKGTFGQIENYLREKTEERNKLEYEIDGLVIKVDNLKVREQLGYTGHHPRWAVAYKFESSEAESVVLGIDVQVGRTGRVTPVARVEPVEISGSVVSNVTLHNQDYVNFLNLSPGDRVTVSKRGDVIPAVENVVEKGNTNASVWKMPETCPFCGTGLEKEGAHLFCVNRQCPERVRGKIVFFCSKDQMNIENLGYETIDLLVREKIVKNIYDLYEFDFSALEKYEGFGPKKIELIRKGIENSKKKPFRTVLSSLGLPEIGPKVCELLIGAGLDSAEKIIETAEKKDYDFLLSIKGIGEKTAESFMENFSDPETIQILEKLRESGLSMKAENEGKEVVDNSFSGQTWCVTGSFDYFRPRSLAEEEIKKRGGVVVSQVSGKTTHLLAGISPVSKYEKAVKLGIQIIDEESFGKLLNDTVRKSG